jgi:DNA-binding GntR family transcriptional regulator
MSLLVPVRADTLRSQVARILRDAIFSGELKPGEPLRELALARQLDVSQATVREALTDLEQIGLVVKMPNKGTTVTNLSATEVRERLAIRLVLEQMAAIEAAKRMQAPEFAELEDLSAQITAGIEQNAYFEVSQADAAFHRAIWRFSRNQTLERILDQVTTPLFAFLGLLHRIQGEDQRKTRPHLDLVAALRTRRPAAIREAFRNHIEGSYGALLNSNAEDLLTLVENG